ncbi:MAG TPA: bifunctional 5,10-methylenetetrahydrofolate dehydrogenase/5,10-methenyltetrahydrofolate cyclohydrolase [Bacteroidia bacterium]|nr:bifunctional 5,10-methylenetetrahydrofolate dehydrogenase/5,10-methenyltetrahydrofolate cyclohydrolase [Bacteroidia bacterium]HRS58855.1 bifunctional 5,10-methylenetetrahydrofolate dehydrogenase/5,10-methenyltetrahydrofolate cyclohydrolase [Bacteroidia bacterium]HRU69329.1 bifunctional 5,10-methylenetetrahydrofolate dehydrogenase/5,10-methenyltetrahydrofolate cyclohydrolase [Bacteroidia bacterium]
MILLDGKQVAEKIRGTLKEECRQMVESGMKPPSLAVVLVGNNPSSETYVRNKLKACEETGFHSRLIRLPDNVSEQKLMETIDLLNEENETDGFIIQTPLPPHIREENIIIRIQAEKDVDGFHPENLGKMMRGLPALLPATPKGIVDLLHHYHIETTGKHCVILGRSLIVGTPLAVLLSRKANPGNCTVTILHSQSKNIPELTQQADILVAAIGKAHFVTADMVKDGAVVIDVGTNSIPDNSKKSGYRLTGDVDFEQVSPKCSYISPVPGGVGPMTIAGLLQNTLQAAKNRRSMK